MVSVTPLITFFYKDLTDMFSDSSHIQAFKDAPEGTLCTMMKTSVFLLSVSKRRVQWESLVISVLPGTLYIQ